MHVVGEQAEPGPVPKQDLQERSLLAAERNGSAERVLLRCSWISVARPSRPLRLCGAPHNRNYVERAVMPSPRVTASGPPFVINSLVLSAHFLAPHNSGPSSLSSWQREGGRNDQVERGSLRQAALHGCW